MADNISRHEALKKIGLVTGGTALAMSGAYALTNSNSSYKRKDMKVLLVNGSPHREGCTYTALTEVSKALNGEGIDTEFYWIGTKP